jgi:hypothetical protein
MFGVWCNFRYEVFPFFSGRPLLQLPAFVETPPPPPSPSATSGEKTKNRIGTVLAIVMPAIAAILLMVVACFCCWKRIKKRRPEEQTFLSCKSAKNYGMLAQQEMDKFC